MVFLTGKPMKPQVEWVSQAKKPMSVIFPLKKHTRAVFCLSHATNKSIEAFFARIVTNLIQKFKTQSSALMSQRRYADVSNDAITSRWRYADRGDDVTSTRH
jgi:hypothetical protein